MYYQAIKQCTQAVKNVEAWLDKAEKHATAKHFDVGVLVTGRLAPDMKPFIYQVQSACDYLKAAAAWLSGQKAPKHEDTEQTIDDVRARIRKTVAFAESVTEAQYAGAAEQRVSLSFAPAGKVLVGPNYLLQMTIPNIYFHLAMARPCFDTTASTSAKWTSSAPLTGSTPEWSRCPERRGALEPFFSPNRLRSPEQSARSRCDKLAGTRNTGNRS
jgi:uncharacterized protein